MEDPEKEKYYDEVIAPILLDISNKCREAQITFLATAFITPETYGITAFVPEECNSAHIRTVEAAIKAGGNADSLIWWMMKHGKKHGHNSACLSILERV